MRPLFRGAPGAPDCRGASGVFCSVWLPDDKREKYAAELNAVVRADSLNPGAAAKLVGKLE